MSRKEHSVKVPRLYKVAAGILKAHKNGSYYIQLTRNQAFHRKENFS